MTTHMHDLRQGVDLVDLVDLHAKRLNFRGFLALSFMLFSLEIRFTEKERPVKFQYRTCLRILQDVDPS